MPLIQWGPELQIGIQSVDDQHLKLVKMINVLHEAMSQGQGDLVVGRILDSLSLYVEKHFGYEERLFEKYGYPQRVPHQRQHQALVSKLHSLKAQFDQGEKVITMELMHLLKTWLETHILIEDRAFVPFLKEQGVG